MIISLHTISTIERWANHWPNSCLGRLMHNTEPPETQFFLQECNEREANFAFTRPVGSVGLSKLFTSLKASKPIRKRFITFGLDRMPQTYLAASLGKELILTEEEPGRTEVRLITTDDGRPCEFIIQRFNTMSFPLKVGPLFRSYRRIDYGAQEAFRRGYSASAS